MVNKNIMIIAVIIVSFLAISKFTSGIATMESVVYNVDNTIFNTQELTLPKGLELTQSLFGTDLGNSLSTMQSSYPLSQQQKNVQFSMLVENPFNTDAFMVERKVMKGDTLLSTEPFVNQPFGPKEQRQFQTGLINLEGTKGSTITIKIIYTFKDNGGQMLDQVFTYSYLYLTQCDTDDDCSFPSIKCDVANLGQFIKPDSVNYCLRPCTDNNQCSEGQLCRRGVCAP